jgi:hypothetical protein
VPAEELDEFNEHLVGPIEVVHEFGRAPEQELSRLGSPEQHRPAELVGPRGIEPRTRGVPPVIGRHLPTAADHARHRGAPAVLPPRPGRAVRRPRRHHQPAVPGPLRLPGRHRLAHPVTAGNLAALGRVHRPRDPAALHAHLTAAAPARPGGRRRGRHVTGAFVAALTGSSPRSRRWTSTSPRCCVSMSTRTSSCPSRAPRRCAARLLAEIGDCRARSPPPCRSPAGGVTPSTRQCGKLKTTSFRWSADEQLRDPVCGFAADSCFTNPWVAGLYDRARARHPTGPAPPPSIPPARGGSGAPPSGTISSGGAARLHGHEPRIGIGRWAINRRSP